MAARSCETYSCPTENPELGIFWTGKQVRNIYDYQFVLNKFFAYQKFQPTKYAQIVQVNRCGFPFDYQMLHNILLEVRLLVNLVWGECLTCTACPGWLAGGWKCHGGGCLKTPAHWLSWSQETWLSLRIKSACQLQGAGPQDFGKSCERGLGSLVQPLPERLHLFLHFAKLLSGRQIIFTTAFKYTVRVIFCHAVYP